MLLKKGQVGIHCKWHSIPSAIPFNIHFPPPMDEVSKILAPKKKISKCRQADTKYPSGICKLSPSSPRRDQRMPAGLTTQKRLSGNPSEKCIHRGGGGGGCGGGGCGNCEGHI